MTMKMFWGLILEPGKKYEQKADASFHLTMAALEPSSKTPAPNKSSITSVLLESNKTQYILCNLDQTKTLQQPLDCVFVEGEDITFSVNGESKVHLTGYIMPDSDMEESEDMYDDSEEDSEEEIAALQNDKKRKLVQEANAGKKLKVGGDESVKAGKKEENAKPAKGGKQDISIKINQKAKSEDEDDEDDDEDDDLDSDNIPYLLDSDEDEEDEDEEDEDMEESSPEVKKQQQQKQQQKPQQKTPQQKGGDVQQKGQQQKGQQQTPPQKKPFQQGGGKQQWSHGKNKGQNNFNKNQNSGKKGTPQNNKFGSPGGKKNKPWNSGKK